MSQATATDISNLHATAAEAERVRDWRQAASLYAAMRLSVPAREVGWLGEARALRGTGRLDEMHALLAEAVARFPEHFPIFVEYARAAELGRDWPEAHRRWELLKDRFPDRVEGPLGMALALREQRRYDEAEARLQRALHRFPDDTRLLEASALLAQVRRDWPTAASRWAAVLAHAPDHQAAHLGTVAALREAGRAEDAEAALAAAQSRLAPSYALLAEEARLAAAGSDWDRAANAWQAARAHAPAAPQPIAEIAELLILQKRYDEAEQLLAPELSRFADRPDLAMVHAKVASRRRDWAEAARRWAPLDQKFPGNQLILTGLAESHWALKDEAALIATLDRLLALQPHSVAAAILYARLEMRRGRAGDAVRRLAAAQAQWPNNNQIRASLSDARLAALVDMPEETAPGVQPKSAAPAPEAVPDNLFARFESLGSGCEFGLLQRRFGAEPLSLLRWATITPRGLIEMLERRFDGVGDIASTRIKPDGDSYALFDSQYDIVMQTFIATKTEAADTLLPKLCKRQRFLARQLNDRLTQTDRIMVYKATQPMPEADTRRLFHALRAYGTNTLLIVQLADADHAPGSLDRPETGLMLGYVDRYSNTDISVQPWTQICRAASEAWTPPN